MVGRLIDQALIWKIPVYLRVYRVPSKLKYSCQPWRSPFPGMTMETLEQTPAFSVPLSELLRAPSFLHHSFTHSNLAYFCYILDFGNTIVSLQHSFPWQAFIEHLVYDRYCLMPRVHKNLASILKVITVSKDSGRWWHWSRAWRIEQKKWKVTPGGRDSMCKGLETSMNLWQAWEQLVAGRVL